MLDRYGVMKVMYYTVCHGVSGSNRYCSEFLLLKICVREKMAYSSQVEFLKFEVDPIRLHADLPGFSLRYFHFMCRLLTAHAQRSKHKNNIVLIKEPPVYKSSPEHE